MTLYALRCHVQRYAWGSRSALPALLDRPEDGEPQAELWVGAHPTLPCEAEVGGRWVRLDELIAADPIGHMGTALVKRFGAELPMLMKILAVDAPLSLQAHPSAQQAIDGYAREDRAGIALESPRRSYRDRGAKPELVYAVTPFQALCGFLPPDAAADALQRAGGTLLQQWAAALRSRGASALSQTVGELLTLPEPEQAALVAEVAASDDTVLRDLAQRYPRDAGVIVAAMLQRHDLNPGEAMFVPAGMLHAYLSGVAVEVQANSDNVLRGGLTPKNIDVPELMRVLDPAVQPVYLPPDHKGSVVTFAPPDASFALSVFTAADRDEKAPRAWALRSGAPSLLLCIEGSAEVNAKVERLTLNRGDAAFVSATDVDVVVRASAVVLQATIPEGI